MRGWQGERKQKGGKGVEGYIKERGGEMVETILIVLVMILFASRMKWRVTTLSLLYYLEKNLYRLPSDEGMKECTEFVIKNMLKDLTGR